VHADSTPGPAGTFDGSGILMSLSGCNIYNPVTMIYLLRMSEDLDLIESAKIIII
jgi:hypothetical protein